MSDLGAIFHVKKAGVQYDAHAYTTTDECPEPNLKIKFKGSPSYIKLEAKGSGDVPCYVKKSDGGVFQVKKEAVAPTGSTIIDGYGTFTVPSGVHVIKINCAAGFVYVGVTPNTTHKIHVDVDEISEEHFRVEIYCTTHSNLYLDNITPSDETSIVIHWSPEINKQAPKVTDY